MSPRLDLPEAAERVLSTWLAAEGFGGPVAESVTRVRYGSVALTVIRRVVMLARHAVDSTD
jgi:hypothetical protein